MVHMFLYELHVGLDRVWCQQMQQGMNLTQGWGSSSTSLCPTKLNPQHLPSCQEERGAGTPRPPLINIPSKFTAVAKRR